MIVNVSPRQINQAGIDLIKEFEGLRLLAYADQVGVETLGFGHTGPDVKVGETITEEQAEQLLMKDLAKFEQGVNDLVKVALTDNQFAALVSFSYNLGLGSLKESTLLKLVNSSNFDDAAKQFIKWDYAGGVLNEGLLRRRTAEAALFQLASSNSNE